MFFCCCSNLLSQGDRHVLSLNVPEYCNARENWLCKTSTRHRKNSKQSRIVAIGSCFAIVAALQYGITTRESSVEKNPCTLVYLFKPDLPPWPTTHNTHRRHIMPYHVSPGGQEAKCQVDVSERKYKRALASRKELTNRVEELLMQFMQISTRNTGRCGSGFVITRWSWTLKNARRWFSRESLMPAVCWRCCRITSYYNQGCVWVNIGRFPEFCKTRCEN